AVQAQSAREICGLRVRAVAELGSGVYHAVVVRGAAEAQVQRAGRCGFGPAGVWGRVLGRVPPHGAKAARAGECDQHAGDAGGDEVGDVIEARGSPAEGAPTRFDVADHAVGGVQGFVGEEAGEATDDQPECRGDDGVVETFGEAFDGGGGYFGGAEGVRVAADDVADGYA